MAEAVILDSIAVVDAQRWDECFPGALEDHACLLATERAGLPGFDWRWIVVQERGRPIAAAPAFVARYPLDTMMEGRPARVVAMMRQGLPQILAPRLAAIGSPCLESARIGFPPDIPAAFRPALAGLVIDALARLGADERCPLLAFKDMPDADAASVGTALEARGYVATAGQPVAWLPIDFADVDAYLARLSRATRRDLRRKLRASTHVRIERRTAIADVLTPLIALYRATLKRAAHRFEELTPAYFTGLLAAMPGRASCTLYWVDDALLGANLLIEDGTALLDKYWCMADAGRDHHLYHLSWIVNIRHCLARGLTRYQAGQACEGLKRSLGCRFDGATTFVRHRNTLYNHALRHALPLLGAIAPQRTAA